MRWPDEILKKIFSTSILLALFLFALNPARASLDLTDGTESLNELVLEGSANTIGKKAKAREIYPNKAYLYNYRALSKSKLGDNEGADEDVKKEDKL